MQLSGKVVFRPITKCSNAPPGGGYLGALFAGLCVAGISEPLSQYSLFLVYLVANYRTQCSIYKKYPLPLGKS